jgi:signal peptidase I
LRFLRRLASLGISLAVALIIVLVLRTFVFQLYVVEQQSMENTISPGSVLVVDKLSLAFDGPEHGDILVFTPPASLLPDEVQTAPAANPLIGLLFGQSQYTPFIKRVIGIPGDTIRLTDNGDVYLNGLQLAEPYVNSTNGTHAIGSPLDVAIGATATCPAQPAGAPQFCWTVGPGQLFMMGDHRDESTDSRIFGPIDASTVIGRVYLRISGDGGFGGFNRSPWSGNHATDYGNGPATGPLPSLPPANPS